MRFFCKPYSVCGNCGVHFEPIKGDWNHLCSICRKPHVERQARIDRVVAWARHNWEKLEEQAKKERDEYADVQRKYYAEYARQGMENWP